MSGHSKWANIKHRKQGADKQRGILFSKLSRELMIASRLGGSDPHSNTRLRIAVSRARDSNMPKDTIDRAIKKGAGELDGINYEEVSYEVFGPGGVALMIESLTEKKSRTTPEIKNILNKHNAGLAETNAVSRLFERRGVLSLACDTVSEERLIEVAAEAGAMDVRQEDNVFEVLTTEADYSAVSEALAKEKIAVIDSGVRLVPIEGTQIVVQEPALARKVLGLIETLEGHEDVQAVHSNFDIPEDILNQV